MAPMGSRLGRSLDAHEHESADAGARQEPAAPESPVAGIGGQALAQLAGNPQAARVLAAASHGLGNQAVQRLAASAPVGQSGVAVQRTIKINGKNIDLAKEIQGARDMKEKLVFANWGWSDTEYNFKGEDDDDNEAWEKLDEAVARAKAAVPELPDLYKPANLRFMTKEGGRLPTLYFVSGGTSGRIRQQHGSGPAVISQEGKVDYFFGSMADAKLFRSAIKRDIHANPAAYRGSLNPQDGANHLEVTFEGEEVSKTHVSAGLSTRTLRATTWRSSPGSICR